MGEDVRVPPGARVPPIDGPGAVLTDRLRELGFREFNCERCACWVQSREPGPDLCRPCRELMGMPLFLPIPEDAETETIDIGGGYQLTIPKTKPPEDESPGG